MDLHRLFKSLPDFASADACAPVIDAILDAARADRIDALAASIAVRDVVVYHLDPLETLPDSITHRVEAWIVERWTPAPTRLDSVLIDLVDAARMPRARALLERADLTAFPSADADWVWRILCEAGAIADLPRAG